MKSALSVCIFLALFFTVGCSRNRDGDRVLRVEPVELSPGGGGGETELSGIFNRPLGSLVSASEFKTIKCDATGLSAATDFDGDGISNEQEVTTNPYVADYPKIVTRISTPLTMEIRVSSTSVEDNHTEAVEDSGVTNTISNSMEDRQYSQLNRKTTPYVTKESQSTSNSDSSSWGKSHSVNNSGGGGFSLGSAFSANGNGSKGTTDSSNGSIATAFSQSTSSESMEFTNVDYMDNLDRNGVAFTDDTVEKITRNARISNVLKNTSNIGPNAGIVRTALFLKNDSVNFPARIKNLKCTLSFRTPAGKFLPVKTFLLRNDDWSVFEQDIYGNEELGPYTIEVGDLNTNEVTQALKNGYVPQISVVSYDISRVADSNYNPGVNNLKIVEETAKGRTAMIKISGSDLRDTFRVCAFDVDSAGNISPGISLKKALFNILRSRVGRGENWEKDENGNSLTVYDSGLKWKAGSINPHAHAMSRNTVGNSWDDFETYVKSYKDENNNVHYVETIKRIDGVEKYNPFDVKDNPDFNPNELLTEREVRKMKYWYILHNGKYFTGDINDPIWAGDRYEIICVDVDDYNNHFKSFNFTPIQSNEMIEMDTRWNRLSNDGEFSRAVYFGKVYRDDTVKIEVDLKQSRFLLDNLTDGNLSAPSNSWSFAATDMAKYFKTENSNDTENNYSGSPSEFGFTASGGINSLAVDIETSENAYKYDIDVVFPGGVLRHYEVSSSKLYADGNRFNINRITEDSRGNASGELMAGDYKLNVKAWGLLYGYPVSKSASRRNVVVEVSGTQQLLPGSYSFGSYGKTESFTLNIYGGSNTEYYLVRCTGPMNDGQSDHPVQLFRASAGLNTFSVSAPSEAFRPMIESYTPGVYKIEVLPVNSKFPEGDASVENAFAGLEQYVTVNFERFSEQKNLRAKKKNELCGFESVNIEVNFDDGSGWHRLVVMGSFNGQTDIDCRGRQYYDRSEQKFYVTFKPPRNDGISLFDIFSGGRDSAKLYVRTTPKDEYRDRFWPRPGSGVTVSRTGRADTFSNLWVRGETSDATVIEDVVPCGGADGINLSSSNIRDYFFSPYEYRVYGVKVELNDDMWNIADSSVIDASIALSASNAENGIFGNGKIFVTGVSSNYCEHYEIFYRQVCGESAYQAMSAAQKRQLCADLQNENIFTWCSSGEFSAGSSGGVLSPSRSVISGLVPNTVYCVGIVGTNAARDRSVKSYYTNSDGSMGLITVRDTSKPGLPDSCVLSLSGDGKTVNVGNIVSSCATAFCLQYRRLSDSRWESSGEEMFLSPSYSFVGDEWETYLVRVRGYNEYAPDADKYGDYSEYRIKTDVHPVAFSCSAGWDGSCTRIFEEERGDRTIKTSYGGIRVYFPVNASTGQIDVFPKGTVSYSLGGNLSYVNEVSQVSGYPVETARTCSFEKGYSDTNVSSQLIVSDLLVGERWYSTPYRYPLDTYDWNDRFSFNITVKCRNIYGEVADVNFYGNIPDFTR